MNNVANTEADIPTACKKTVCPCLDVAPGCVVLPIIPIEEMWTNLARDIIMWMDMYEGSKMTPRNLFLHLGRIGTIVPQWLKDEPEMKCLDSVPSKGTRAVLIYRAMTAEAFTSKENT